MLSISIIASIFAVETVIACIVHALILAQWIFFYSRPRFGNYTIGHYFMSIAFGFVYIFNYYSTQDGPNFHKYLFYYTICGIENVICIILSWYFVNDDYFYIYLNLYVAIICCFVFAIVFQILYYKKFHPNVININ